MSGPFKMKYKKGGFPFKIDLTKKTGKGPTIAANPELMQDTDDQSRKVITILPVMKSGSKNKPLIKNKKTGKTEVVKNWENPHAIKP